MHCCGTRYRCCPHTYVGGRRNIAIFLLDIRNTGRRTDTNWTDGRTDGRTDILKSTTMWGSLRLAPIKHVPVLFLLQLRQLLRKGIPTELRSKVWQLFLNSHTLKAQSSFDYQVRLDILWCMSAVNLLCWTYNMTISITGM